MKERNHVSLEKREPEKKKILIADDDRPTLKILEVMLLEAGYSVILAADGTLALSLARSEHPDLAILDIAMPGMDGLEVGLVMKREPQTRLIPVIFLSSQVGGEFKEGMDSLLAANFLPKPIQRDLLLKEIKRVLWSR
jgi:two-component system alkaline phosphatase synthesis response regulator PhoP